MHIFNDAQKRVQEFVSENSTTLLTAGGVVGTVTTAVLAGRAGFKAACHVHGEALQTSPDDRTVGEDLIGLPDFTRLEKAQMTWQYYAPSVITGGATIASIVLAHRMTAQKAAALAAAYGLSQKQFEEYKEKVTEKLTGPKKQQITDELAQDQVNKTPGANLVIISGDDVLCFDRPTGRYFKSTMDKINRAVISTNQEINNHGYASASYFYSELELPDTTWADDVGWNLDNMLELDLSTTEHPEDGRPCLVINFAKFPIEDFHRKLY